MATAPIRSLLGHHTSFPDALYYRPNAANYFNGIHSLMLANMGLGETIAAADPEHLEWMFLLSVARRIGESPQYPLDEYLDPIARVPLHCMPAMLWLHKEDPASYQWILENLDSPNTANILDSKTILAQMLELEGSNSSWGQWFTWEPTPQGFKHWETLANKQYAELDALANKYEEPDSL